MGVMSIPVRLSLSESCAAALTLAADALESANSADDFIRALDDNHCLWLCLAAIVERQNWLMPDQRLVRFVLSTVHQSGKALADDHIESLIHINRSTAEGLVRDQMMDRILHRASAAWADAGRRLSSPLNRWLLGEIERKSMF